MHKVDKRERNQIIPNGGLLYTPYFRSRPHFIRSIDVVRIAAKQQIQDQWIKRVAVSALAAIPAVHRLLGSLL